MANYQKKYAFLTIINPDRIPDHIKSGSKSKYQNSFYYKIEDDSPYLEIGNIYKVELNETTFKNDQNWIISNVYQITYKKKESPEYIPLNDNRYFNRKRKYLPSPERGRERERIGYQENVRYQERYPEQGRYQEQGRYPEQGRYQERNNYNERYRSVSPNRFNNHTQRKRIRSEDEDFIYKKIKFLLDK